MWEHCKVLSSFIDEKRLENIVYEKSFHFLSESMVVQRCSGNYVGLYELEAQQNQEVD